MRKKIFASVFAVWVILWIWFMGRELFRKGYFHDYKALITRSLEGKRSYVTGDGFYAFLTFCNKNLPSEANYRWIGLEDGSLEKRRATYYLYPHMERQDANFILVYDERYAAPSGYELFARLDKTGYILKKR